MLEDDLDLLPPVFGTRLDSPATLDALHLEYFHAASLWVRPDESHDPSPDMDRVLTLRPNGASPYYTPRAEQGVMRGYFAWGKRENSDAVFEIYAPHPSVKARFPPKKFEIAIALFAMRLIQEGYSIHKNAVRFFAHIER